MRRVAPSSTAGARTVAAQLQRRHKLVVHERPRLPCPRLRQSRAEHIDAHIRTRNGMRSARR
jgi:hypothetical protein